MKVGADMTENDVGNVLRRHHKSETMLHCKQAHSSLWR